MEDGHRGNPRARAARRHSQGEGRVEAQPGRGPRGGTGGGTGRGLFLFLYLPWARVWPGCQGVGQGADTQDPGSGREPDLGEVSGRPGRDPQEGSPLQPGLQSSRAHLGSPLTRDSAQAAFASHQAMQSPLPRHSPEARVGSLHWGHRARGFWGSLHPEIMTICFPDSCQPGCKGQGPPQTLRCPWVLDTPSQTVRAGMQWVWAGPGSQGCYCCWALDCTGWHSLLLWGPGHLGCSTLRHSAEQTP